MSFGKRDHASLGTILQHLIHASGAVSFEVHGNVGKAKLLEGAVNPFPHLPSYTIHAVSGMAASIDRTMQIGTA